MNLSNIIDSLSNLSWPRVAVVILLTFFVVLVIVLYESYTHSFGLERTERALALAKNAEEYRNTIKDDLTPEQKQIYSATVQAANAAITETGMDSPFTEQQAKFICGFFPWLLMALVFVGNTDNEKYVGMFGAVILGVFSAAILSFLPKFFWHCAEAKWRGSLPILSLA